MCAGTVRTKGNACAIEQDINPLVSSMMPLNVAKSGMMLMRVAGTKTTHVDLRVRRDMVRQMIRFHLESGTPEYPKGVDEKYLNSLPEDGVPDDLLVIEVDSEKDIDAFAQGPPLLGKPDGGYDRLRYVGQPIKERVQEQVIRNVILEKDPFIDYPKLGDTPYNEWDTPWLGSLCFPHLFPGGRGDPWDPNRKQEVSIKEAAQHLLHFRHKDPRSEEYFYPFAEDQLFPCWIGNLIHRHEVIKQVAVCMNKNDSYQNLTRAQLEEMATKWEFKKLMKAVSAYVGNVMMTPEYWFRQRRLLQSMQESEGPFDVFYTHSYCSLYDPYLHRLYQHPPHEGRLTKAMRGKVKKKVPHLVTAFITERMNVIGEHWLFGTMNAKMSWSREEWQARDEKHRHGLGQHAMKLNHRQNAEIAVAGKRAQFLLKQDTTELSQRAALEEQVANGKAAEQKIVRAVDLLVSNCHPDVDSIRSVWQIPVPHPCTIPYAEVLRDFNDEQKAQHETALWNVVGRHTKCTSYCLRTKKSGYQKCRFHFGDDKYKPLCKATKVVYDITYPKNEDGKADKKKMPSRIQLRVVNKRNDKLACDINETMFFGTGFNCDYKVVVDAYKLNQYCAKYTSKVGQERTFGFFYYFLK